MTIKERPGVTFRTSLWILKDLARAHEYQRDAFETVNSVIDDLRAENARLRTALHCMGINMSENEKAAKAHADRVSPRTNWNWQDAYESFLAGAESQRERILELESIIQKLESVDRTDVADAQLRDSATAHNSEEVTQTSDTGLVTHEKSDGEHTDGT